ncbi:hypothetical protein GJ744_000937 [Endocarpon pusillum]|uniref:RING-type domain-containing protein n=1 Tax=Endocarpon pusillum TaxID=364733 RepID=A0A8H7E3M9_9EURO|nr:hypothetical protein GJ744_000937 [Endocarpon pusillum]
MGAITSTSAMRSLPGPAAGTASLLQTFQAHVEDMRNLVLCKICIKPLYEPYTLGCGHTYCYSCLTSWFGGAPNRRKRKNCPDCRAAVAIQPSPNYLLRDLVHMFISRVELLPEDETTAEHDEAKRIEAQLIETDRTTRTDGEPGLFKGAFSKARVQLYGPIHDEEDGVLRCPRCTWEMEDGECGQCGYAGTGFSDGEDYDTMGTPSVVSIEGSTTDPDIDVPYYYNHILDGQPTQVRDDFSDWVRRDQAARRARRAARENRLGRQDRATTVDTEAVEAELRHRYQDHPGWHLDEDDDAEMAAFVERHPYDEQRWNTDTAETVDEDEEMSSAIEDEDEDDESTTSFHRAAILARDGGMYPPFESDLSTNGEMETVTNGGNSSDASTESDDGSDATEPTPVVQRLANRPARIVIDSDDESSSDSSTEEEEEDEEETSGASNEEEEEETEESGDDDSTPSPPRPAAVRRARVEMHRGRRGIRGGGRGGSRGRPRAGN